MPILAFFLLIGSAIGLGLLSIKLLRLEKSFSSGERLVFAYAIGFGTIGWLLFPLGVIGLVTPKSIACLLVLGCIGLSFLKPIQVKISGKFDWSGIILLLLIFIALSLDLVEALAPPGDADTLAYHFTIPRQFAETGRIEFVRQAFVGAVPLLTHMTYMAAFELGGELTATLWTMASGWGVVALLFVMCRRHLSANWSMAISLTYLTIPAVVFGGGSGQIEPRLALYVLVAAWATAQALKTRQLQFAILAGVAVGFYMGSKYFGAFFALACGLILISHRKWLTHGVVYSVAALGVGFQWYLWNFIHTGDPVFPMLFSWIGNPNLDWWQIEKGHAATTHFLGLERAVPTNLVWLFKYPFVATFDSLPAFEAKRIGFGVFIALVAPFSVLGVLKFRERAIMSPLFPYAMIAILFYVLWFFFGPSQRIRHLLPILPLLLICLSASALRYVQGYATRYPLIVAISISIIIQTPGSVLFSKKYIQYFIENNSRKTFLDKQVKFHEVVFDINRLLNNDNKILLNERQLIYFLTVPYLFASPHIQTSIDSWPVDSPANELYSQLRRKGITHLLLRRLSEGQNQKYSKPFEVLREAGCIVNIKSLKSQTFKSRTLPHLAQSPVVIDILKLGELSCIQNRI